MDEKLKIILHEMQTEHNRKIDRQMTSLIFMGFMFGVFFSYTNLLSLGVGFGMGVFMTRKFEGEMHGYTKNVASLFFDVLKLVRS